MLNVLIRLVSILTIIFITANITVAEIQNEMTVRSGIQEEMIKVLNTKKGGPSVIKTYDILPEKEKIRVIDYYIKLNNNPLKWKCVAGLISVFGNVQPSLNFLSNSRNAVEVNDIPEESIVGSLNFLLDFDAKADRLFSKDELEMFIDIDKKVNLTVMAELDKQRAELDKQRAELDKQRAERAEIARRLKFYTEIGAKLDKQIEYLKMFTSGH